MLKMNVKIVGMFLFNCNLCNGIGSDFKKSLSIF
jgi:hypothetical protein